MKQYILGCLTASILWALFIGLCFWGEMRFCESRLEILATTIVITALSDSVNIRSLQEGLGKSIADGLTRDLSSHWASLLVVSPFVGGIKPEQRAAIFRKHDLEFIFLLDSNGNVTDAAVFQT
jgi:hypothetical protein